MNVGSWLLGAYAPAAGLAAIADLSGRAPSSRRTATFSAAALAPAIATYTAVLVSDTAIPAWHDLRQQLPLLFAAGAAAAAGGAVCVVLPDSAPARSFATLGALAEVAFAERLHPALEPEVAEAYKRGAPQRLSAHRRGCAPCRYCVRSFRGASIIRHADGRCTHRHRRAHRALYGDHGRPPIGSRASRDDYSTAPSFSIDRSGTRAGRGALSNRARRLTEAVVLTSTCGARNRRRAQ